MAKTKSTTPFERTRVIPRGSRYIPDYAWGTTRKDGQVLSSGVTKVTPTPNSEVMTDVVTPGFAQRIARGEIVNNPMSHSRLIAKGGTSGPLLIKGPYIGDPFYECSSFMEQGFTACCGISSPLPPRNVSEIERLVPWTQTDALSKVEKPDIQTFVALGEFRKTCKMLLRPLRGMLDALARAERRYENDLKRLGKQQMRANHARSAKERARRRAQIVRGAKGKQKDAGERAASFGDHVSDVILTYNLGIKPLMKDVDNLLYKIPIKEVSPSQTVRAMQRIEDDFTVVDYRDMYFGRAFIETKAKGFVSVRAAVRFKSKIETPSIDFGTRLIDVPDALWELLTLSFLIDYFVNIGAYLSALRAQLTAEFESFSTTVEFESKRTRTFKSFTPGTAYDRVPYTVVSVPLGSSEDTECWMKYRSPVPFSAQLSYDLNVFEQAPSHLQNICGLILKRLISIRSK